MKQIFVLLLVSIIATQKQSDALGDGLNVLQPVVEVVGKVLRLLGAAPRNAREMRATKMAGINAIAAHIADSSPKIDRKLNKNSKCGVKRIRIYWNAMLSHANQLKADIDADTKLLTKRTNITLDSLRGALEKLDKAIDKLLTPECKTSCLSISEEANSFYNNISRDVKSLHVSVREYLKKGGSHANLTKH